MSKKIVMIDYGAGNIRSAQKAFEHLGAEITLTDRPEEVLAAKKLVLPGVGAFGAGMDALRKNNLDSAIVEAVNKGVPFLGICLGMQFLFNQSNEMGIHKGLSLLPGHVTRFDLAEEGLKVPHMGWNQIEFRRDHKLLSAVPDASYAYFVHSYYCVPDRQNDIIAETQFGRPFPSCVGRDNIFGIQFHPEKSQKIGLQILQNFIRLA